MKNKKIYLKLINYFDMLISTHFIYFNYFIQK